MNTRIILSIILTFISICTARADEPNQYRFEASLYGGLYINNEQAWQIEPSVAWHFHKYFGIALGLELTGQYNQPSRMTSIDGHEAELASNQRNAAWILFKPSVIFKSPALWKSADGFSRLWIQAEPGLSLGTPFHNSLTYELYEFHGAIRQPIATRRFPNHGLRWFYWNARASVNLALDRFIIGAGYGISNLDYYSGRRNVTLADGQKFHVPKKELSHSIFLSLGYAF